MNFQKKEFCESDSSINSREEINFNYGDNPIYVHRHNTSESPNSHSHCDDQLTFNKTSYCRQIHRHPQFSELPLEWWERSPDCKMAKSLHTERIDSMFGSREDLVLLTTLYDEDVVLEPNMFPCKKYFISYRNILLFLNFL